MDAGSVEPLLIRRRAAATREREVRLPMLLPLPAHHMLAMRCMLLPLPAHYALATRCMLVPLPAVPHQLYVP